jgi:hypothetical protein
MPEPTIRVGDDQRETAIARLGAALGEGRLAMAEFEQRAAAAAQARTGAELAALTADLPEAAAERKRRDAAEWLAEWRYWLGGAVIMNAIWAGQWIADGDRPDYWPAAPLLIWAGILVAVALWPRSSGEGRTTEGVAVAALSDEAGSSSRSGEVARLSRRRAPR